MINWLSKDSYDLYEANTIKNVGVFRVLHNHNSWTRNITSQDCKIAGLQDCRIARLQDRKIAGSQDCRIARLQDRKIAGSQYCRIARLQDRKIAGM